MNHEGWNVFGIYELVKEGLEKEKAIQANAAAAKSRAAD